MSGKHHPGFDQLPTEQQERLRNEAERIARTVTWRHVARDQLIGAAAAIGLDRFPQSEANAVMAEAMEEDVYDFLGNLQRDEQQASDGEPVEHSAYDEAERLIADRDISGEPTWVARIIAAFREYKKNGDNASRAFHAVRTNKFPKAKQRILEVVGCHVFGIDMASPSYVPLYRMKYPEAEKAAGHPTKKAVVVRGHNITPRAMIPLWPELVYFGSATLIFGMPGIGKSTVVHDIMARVTTGAPMPGEPDAARHEPRSVVILTAEDSKEEVIAPQLVAAGADMANVFVVESAKIGEAHTSIDLAKDLGLVEGLMRKEFLLEGSTACPPVGLFVISPITAYLGEDADGNSGPKVRAILDPFFAMLRRHRVASINIGHPRKGAGDEIAMYQNAGSVAFVAAHRVVVMAMANPDQPPDGPRLLLRAKNNLAPGFYGFGYKIVGAVADFGDQGTLPTTRIEWAGRDDRDPDEVMLRAKEVRKERKGGGSKLDASKDLLRRELASGKGRATHLLAMADDAGIGRATFNAAKRAIGVISEKHGAETWWRLPTVEEQEEMPF